MLKIWGRPNSICTQRALWACTEAAVGYELVLASATMGPDGHVSGGSAPYGVVETAAYEEMNPNRTVPTIDDDGFVLWESNAIVMYLASKYAPEALFGRDPQTFARATQWMSWTNEHLEPPLHVLVMELVRLPVSERDSKKVEQARQQILPRLTILDRHLSSRDYVAGDDFTLGDIPTGAAVYRWLRFDLERPEMPAIAGWQARLAERAGFQTHIAPGAYHLA